MRSGGEDIPNTEVQRRIREAAFIMELIDRERPEKYLSMSIDCTSAPSCLVVANHSSLAPARRSTWWPAI